MGFRTKRQRRRRRLCRFSDEQWATIPSFLLLFHETFLGEQDGAGGFKPLDARILRSRSAQRDFRAYAIEAWLDEAEKLYDFAKKLDRYLGLRTDDEDREYHDYWSTKRNKVYNIFVVLAFALSLISIALDVRRFMQGK